MTQYILQFNQYYWNEDEWYVLNVRIKRFWSSIEIRSIICLIVAFYSPRRNALSNYIDTARMWISSMFGLCGKHCIVAQWKSDWLFAEVLIFTLHGLVIYPFTTRLLQCSRVVWYESWYRGLVSDLISDRLSVGLLLEDWYCEEFYCCSRLHWRCLLIDQYSHGSVRQQTIRCVLARWCKCS